MGSWRRLGKRARRQTVAGQLRWPQRTQARKGTARAAQLGCALGCARSGLVSLQARSSRHDTLVAGFGDGESLGNYLSRGLGPSW